jgi:hypothetical protein
MTASPSTPLHDRASRSNCDLGPKLVHPQPTELVAILQEPKRFADDLARRCVAATSNTLLDELLELRRQRHVHQDDLRFLRPAYRR